MLYLFDFTPVINSILYSLIGIIILVVAFYIIEHATPQNIYNEVVEHKNIAVAIVAAAFIIAIAIIVGCAIHG